MLCTSKLVTHLTYNGFNLEPPFSSTSSIPYASVSRAALLLAHTHGAQIFELEASLAAS